MVNSKKSSSLIKQAAILAGAGIIARFIGFIYRPLLTNLIGDVGNAIYGSGYYIYMFLLILSSAGLPAAIAKMVSERTAKGEYKNAYKVFKVSMRIAGILGFLCMVFLAVFAKPIAELVGTKDAYITLLTLAPTLFIVAIMSVYRGYFQGMNTMVPTAVSQVVEQIFNAFFSVFLAYVFVKVMHKGVAMGAAGGTAGTGIGAIAGLLVVMCAYSLAKPMIFKQMKKEGNAHKSENKQQIARTLIRTAGPIIFGAAIFSITNLLDLGMVKSRLDASKAFTETQALALYGQLNGKYVTITTLPVSISTSMATAAIPNIAASLALGQREMVKKKIDMIIRLAMIISIPAAVGIGVMGNQILCLLYPNYSDGGILLTVGSISIIFLALTQIVTGILQGIGKVTVPAVNALFGAGLKLVLNYFLIAIPKINVLGAVIGTIACYMLVSVLNLRALKKYSGVSPNYIGAIFKPLFASILMGIACYSIYYIIYLSYPNNTIATITAIFIAVLFYGLIMVLIKGITREDLSLMPMGGKITRILDKFHLID